MNCRLSWPRKVRARGLVSANVTGQALRTDSAPLVGGDRTSRGIFAAPRIDRNATGLEGMRGCATTVVRQACQEGILARDVVAGRTCDRRAVLSLDQVVVQ